MSLAIPTRGTGAEFHPNSFGMCRYTTPHSALAANPRSFCRYKNASHLHIPQPLKSRIFSRCAHTEPISFTFCRCKMAGVGRYRDQMPKERHFPLPAARHSPPVTVLVTPLDCVFTESNSANPFRMNVCVMYRGGYPPPIKSTQGTPMTRSLFKSTNPAPACAVSPLAIGAPGGAKRAVFVPTSVSGIPIPSGPATGHQSRRPVHLASHRQGTANAGNCALRNAQSYTSHVSRI